MIAPALLMSALLNPGRLVDFEAACPRGSISLPAAARMLDGIASPLKAAGVDDKQLRRWVGAQGGVWARFSERTARSDYLFQSHNTRGPVFEIREEAIVAQPAGFAKLYVRLMLQKPNAQPHVIWLPFESAVPERICS